MGTFAVGDVVLIPFPYADLSTFKKRPALIVGEAEFNNFILCQITSKSSKSQRAILATDKDFTDGSLNLDSYIRPDKLFTIEISVIEKKLGTLNNSILIDIKDSIRQLFK
ncbi:MAG TPA: type II toxin-antitoxin system PemK/MazF family toxin [Candidatus Saccharimonadales bacterium]|nr:type II toxin-antitoxin system PemK/MazF family toxin [Candidatus Saccharimonadales bacterium]